VALRQKKALASTNSSVALPSLTKPLVKAGTIPFSRYFLYYIAVKFKAGRAKSSPDNLAGKVLAIRTF
jgi:hypothetical protein